MKTVSEQLALMLKEHFAAGGQEQGEPINVQKLAQEFQVSTTPVREALRQLHAEGFVDYGSRRGFRIPTLSVTDAEDVYRARVFFEPEALRRSMGNATSEWLTKVQRAYEDLASTKPPAATGTSPNGSSTGLASWIQVHKAFHLVLFERCDSQWWLNQCRRLADDSDRFRPLRIRLGGGGLMSQSAHTHKELYLAVVTGDMERATGILTHHLEHSLEQFRLAAREAPVDLAPDLEPDLAPQ